MGSWRVGLVGLAIALGGCRRAGPTAPQPAATAPAPTPEPCADGERGAEVRGHEFVGETVAALVDRGGDVLCGRDPLWQLRFGTPCGDRASFHDVVTVEVAGGAVRRVWVQKAYNDAFCGGFEP